MSVASFAARRPVRRTLGTARRWVMTHPVLKSLGGKPTTFAVVGVSDRRRQRVQLRRGQFAQPGQCRVGAQSLTERGDRGGAAEEECGQQTTCGGQGVCDPLHPALQPAYGAGRLLGTAMDHRGDRGEAGGALRGRHGVLEFRERARQPPPPGSPAAYLKVMWLWRQYQRGIFVPGGVLRL